MTVLCVDCQRHEIYHTQYRAMFAMNVSVNNREILRYKKKDVKRARGRRKKRRTKPETKKERSRPGLSILAILENFDFAITSKVLRILMEHIETICSLEFKLFLSSICSIRILNILEVIAKTSFSKNAKCSTLDSVMSTTITIITFLIRAI